MQVIKGLILLVHHPCLAVEVYLHYIFGVISVVFGVFFDQCLLNANAQGDLEEVRAVEAVVFAAVFDMINKHF